MAALVKRLRNKKQVIFDKGKFDEWCVYIIECNGEKSAPHDVTYFTYLLEISKYYPKNKVYHDFVSIYSVTSKTVDEAVLTLIDSIIGTYTAEHQILTEQWLAVIYAGMIAEENKANAILKKRVKRLGVHQVLVLGMPPSEAAKFSNGKKWRDLDAIMKSNGF
jgi:hypothetical protein